MVPLSIKLFTLTMMRAFLPALAFSVSLCTSFSIRSCRLKGATRSFLNLGERLNPVSELNKLAASAVMAGSAVKKLRSV